MAKKKVNRKAPKKATAKKKATGKKKAKAATKKTVKKVGSKMKSASFKPKSGPFKGKTATQVIRARGYTGTARFAAKGSRIIGTGKAAGQSLKR